MARWSIDRILFGCQTLKLRESVTLTFHDCYMYHWNRCDLESASISCSLLCRLVPNDVTSTPLQHLGYFGFIICSVRKCSCVSRYIQSVVCLIAGLRKEKTIRQIFLTPAWGAEHGPRKKSLTLQDFNCDISINFSIKWTLRKYSGIFVVITSINMWVFSGSHGSETGPERKTPTELFMPSNPFWIYFVLQV